MKICIITCKSDPDYIRARTLRTAAGMLKDTEVIVVKNTHKGIVRYPEVLWRVLWVRLRLHPDLYLVTFRGYEIFPFVRLLSIGKTLWYDEFINPIEWAALEHKLVQDWKIFRLAYRLLVWPVQLLLTDTESHADVSAEITGIKRNKIVALPVASDGLKIAPAPKHTEPFRVFYYGIIKNPHGLHGVDTVIDAALLLKGQPIEFHFVGAGEKIEAMIDRAVKKGAHMRYDRKLPFAELMDQAARASLCLGGPFGATVQSRYVITGKTYQFLQMAKPVIVGENNESHIFTDRKDALVVPQKDPQALADTILWAYEHRAKLADIGRGGHELYEQKLSVAIVAGILGRLLAKKR